MALGAAALLVTTAGAASAPGGDPVVPEGEIISQSGLGEVRFPHSLHADELGFDCAECHHETAATRLSMPHDEYFEDFWIDCRTCHRESGESAAPGSCAGCHHASPVSTADETLSAKVVIHRSCWQCHDSGTGVEASRSCSFCHVDEPFMEESR
jgi:hypothetical protein